MNAESKRKIADTLRNIVRLLVSKSFAELERLTEGVRLKSVEIESAINQYGRTLIEPSPSAFEKAEIVHVVKRTPEEYSVWFHLWTREEGESDLCLRLTMIDSTDVLLKVQVDDIRVN